MSGLTITQVDTHRMDLRFHGRLLAYAIRDLWGWSVMQLINGELRQVDRVEDAPSLSRRSSAIPRTIRRLADLGQRTFPGPVES